MGLGSIEIAEKKALQGEAPVYLYNFGYKSEQKIPGTDYALGTPHAMDISFDERATMRIDKECAVMRNRFSHELTMWRAIGRL